MPSQVTATSSCIVSLVYFVIISSTTNAIASALVITKTSLAIDFITNAIGSCSKELFGTGCFTEFAYFV